MTRKQLKFYLVYPVYRLCKRFVHRHNSFIENTIKKQKYGMGITAWHTLRKKVIARDGRVCKLCGKVCVQKIYYEYQHPHLLTIDHIVPLREGGKTVLSNLQVVCKACHNLKDGVVKERGYPVMAVAFKAANIRKHGNS